MHVRANPLVHAHGSTTHGRTQPCTAHPTAPRSLHRRAPQRAAGHGAPTRAPHAHLLPARARGGGLARGQYLGSFVELLLEPGHRHGEGGALQRSRAEPSAAEGRCGVGLTRLPARTGAARRGCQTAAAEWGRCDVRGDAPPPPRRRSSPPPRCRCPRRRTRRGQRRLSTDGPAEPCPAPLPAPQFAGGAPTRASRRSVPRAASPSAPGCALVLCGAAGPAPPRRCEPQAGVPPSSALPSSASASPQQHPWQGGVRLSHRTSSAEMSPKGRNSRSSNEKQESSGRADQPGPDT